jgi:hypothetical protein
MTLTTDLLARRRGGAEVVIRRAGQRANRQAHLAIKIWDQIAIKLKFTGK